MSSVKHKPNFNTLYNTKWSMMIKFNFAIAFCTRRGNPAQCDMARLRVPPPTTGVPTMTPPLYNVWTTTPSAVRENGGSSTAAPTGTSPGGRVGMLRHAISTAVAVIWAYWL